MSVAASGITLQTRDGIAWIAFNRPHKANALTLDMLQDLQKALAASEHDESVRAVVLTGAGGRAFSSGADLSVPADSAADFRARRRDAFNTVMRALLDFGKPSVAAVNGAACGYGMMLAMACDAAVAATGAKFSLPEINKGTPTLSGITLVTRRFSSALAADLVLSGRFVAAGEALRLGMVSRVVDDAELAECAQSAALALSRKNARAYAHDKRWLNRELRDALAAASQASAALG